MKGFKIPKLNTATLGQPEPDTQAPTEPGPTQAGFSYYTARDATDEYKIKGMQETAQDDKSQSANSPN